MDDTTALPASLASLERSIRRAGDAFVLDFDAVIACEAALVADGHPGEHAVVALALAHKWHRLGGEAAIDVVLQLSALAAVLLGDVDAVAATAPADADKLAAAAQKLGVAVHKRPVTPAPSGHGVLDVRLKR